MMYHHFERQLFLFPLILSATWMFDIPDLTKDDGNRMVVIQCRY